MRVVYPFDFCCFLHLVHRAFCAARMRAFAAADILRFLPVLIDATVPLAFAHRARCAAAMRARPAADIVRFCLVVPSSVEIARLRASIWEVKRVRSCWSWFSTAFRVDIAGIVLDSNITSLKAMR
jgi:hypothetical protein